MSRYNDTAVIVDDQDPSIQYSGDWQHVPPMGSAEYMSTKSGAGPAGLTATFTFIGSGVEVYISQGSVDVYGIPATEYSIDNQKVGTYVTPVIQPGLYTTHTLSFRASRLSAGKHTLVITNMNGTSPNVFWLDYIVYIPEAVPPQPPPSQSPPQPPPQPPSQSPSQPPSQPSPQPPPSQGSTDQSPPTTPVQPPPTRSASTPSTSATSQPSTDTPFAPNSPTATGSPPPSPVDNQDPDSPKLPDTAAAGSSMQAGPIAGGVVGGIILLALIGLLLFLLYRRRQRKAAERVEAFPSPPMHQVDDEFGFSSPQNQSERVVYGAWEVGNGSSTSGSRVRIPYEMRLHSPTSSSSHHTDPYSEQTRAPPSEFSDSSQDSMTRLFVPGRSTTLSPNRLVPGRLRNVAPSSQSSESSQGSRKGQISNVGVNRPMVPMASTSHISPSEYSGFSDVGVLPQLELTPHLTSPSRYSTVSSSVVIPTPDPVPVPNPPSRMQQNLLMPVVMHADSGVRFQPPRAISEIPPAYSQA